MVGSWLWLWAWAGAAAAGARELDPAACATRFDVQRDKIIRTEESRDMGARYLSELDVGARQECLRLCCETDACDVFVYEEKGPGSCYLFSCGPPEDFRCKFTAHSNFSSGVLAISRRLAELQDQERLAHHEHELANLRSGSGTSSTARPAAPTTAPPAPPPSATPRPTLPVSRCSRYQFECRDGGECIAVYNACDGVPQCADGSDEAPELGCPPAPPAPSALTTSTTTTTTTTPLLLKPLQESVESAAVAAESAALAERWPHRLTQAQPHARYTPPEPGASSHIFSHKGGLLQEPEPPAQFPPFEPPWQHRPWPQPQQPNVGLEGMAGERGWGAYWAEPDPRRAWPVPRPQQEIPVYIPPKTMPEIPVVYSSQQQTLRDSPKKGFELFKKEHTEAPAAEPAPAPNAPQPSPDRREERPPPTTTHKLTTHDKSAESAAGAGRATGGAASGATGGAPAHAHYAGESRDSHDGLADHPPAAMMLLILGMALTGGVGALLACRARAARRRRPRGKSSLAHDADYLVNGMYL